MKKTSQAQIDAVKRYDEKNSRVYSLKLNRKNDSEMIEFLDKQETVSKTIKAAVQQYMDNEK